MQLMRNEFCILQEITLKLGNEIIQRIITAFLGKQFCSRFEVSFFYKSTKRGRQVSEWIWSICMTAWKVGDRSIQHKNHLCCRSFSATGSMRTSAATWLASVTFCWDSSAFFPIALLSGLSTVFSTEGAGLGACTSYPHVSYNSEKWRESNITSFA